MELARKINTSTNLHGENKRVLVESFSTRQRGSLNNPNFRLFFCNDKGPISPFHDIPLKSSLCNPLNDQAYYNMVVEIPRWSNAKMEIATKESLNPIKQDTEENGNLRYISNVFPHQGYLWNYGALPQTWENPLYMDPLINCKGDNDPIDVLEIGSKIHKIGDVFPVKVLGSFCVLDGGETDWKILAIDVSDPLADSLHDIEDIETYMPGLLKESKLWFQYCVVPNGKHANKLALNEDVKNVEFTEGLISKLNDFWKQLSKGEISNKETELALERTMSFSPNSPFTISLDQANKIINELPNPGNPLKVDDSANSVLQLNMYSLVDKWHFMKIDEMSGICSYH